MRNAILYPLDLGVPEVSLFFAFCLVSSLATTVGMILLVWTNPWRLARPGLLVALLLALFFQWPTTLLTDPIKNALPNAWFFALAVNFVPLSLVVWAWLTRFADLPFAAISRPRFNGWQIGLPVGLTLLFSAIYLSRIPIDCTAAYALLFDPSMTLLAREFAGKLAATRLSGYSFGALANTTAPVALALAAASAIVAIRSGRAARLVLWLAVSFAAIGLVMLSGTKGLLVPSFLMIVISAALWNSDLLRKGIAVAISVGVLAIGVVGFELIRERQASGDVRYDLASCSARTGTCAQSKALVASLLAREASLGLSKDEVQRLWEQLETRCDGVEAAEMEETVALPLSSRPRGDLAVDWVGRAVEYAKAIAYRAFVIPTQVASWHFLYVADFGHPGSAAMPLARLFSATQVNMPELVYQRYGVTYSGGDRTITSTSPTTFALAYPAYLGGLGLFVAVFAVIAFDSIWTALVRNISSPLWPVAAGLLAIIGMNLVLSDFVTVMTSHGGAVAAGLLLLYAATKDSASLKRAVDVCASLALMVALAVPAAILALVVRARLGAPVLFVQERPGLHGEPFKLRKFRTMTDARDARGNLLSDEQRLTSFGRFLRSTSLDELPELWNVLKGDMSLVGPRPLLMDYLPLYSAEQARRHEMRPGITGWAQINGRNELGWEERFRLDVWYVDNQSLWLDIRIMITTIGKIFSRKGISFPNSATMKKFEG